MLLSLISVLVLLVIAFYALWVTVLGQVSGRESPELSVGGRVLMLGVAIVAFIGAYLIYRHADGDPSLAAVDVSNPPESRGIPAEDLPVLPKVAAKADGGQDAPVAEHEPESATEVAQADPIAEEAGTGAEATSSDAEGLSASAALLENKRLMAATRRVETAYAPEAVAIEDKRAAPAVPRSSTPEKSSRAPTRSNRSARASSQKALPRGPVLLHLQNSLGRDQQREQLTLSIEGLAVADIEVDSLTPNVTVAVPLPRPGLLHYRLEGVSEADSSKRLVGEGCIKAIDGARFVVRRKPGSRKVFLETTG